MAPQDADALRRWFADRHAVLLAGPGLGESAADVCKALLGRNAPWAGAVLDADALNALAAGKYKGDLPTNTILTPHPGEAARLLGLTAPPQEGLDDYTAAPYRLSYPVYYDLEDKYISGVFPSEMAEITQAFFDRLTEYGYTGAQGLYASRNWVRARMTDPAFDKWRDNLWIARFSDDLDYAGTYDMWQCTFSAPGADYGVQSETVDLDFVMKPFKFTGVSACNGKTATPVLLNDTIWMRACAPLPAVTSMPITATSTALWASSAVQAATPRRMRPACMWSIPVLRHTLTMKR